MRPTSAGIYLENLIPHNAFFVATLNSSDKDEAARLGAFGEREAAIALILNKIAHTGGQEIPLEVIQDVIKKEGAVSFAMVPRGLSSDPDAPPDLYLFLETKSPDAAKSFLQTEGQGLYAGMVSDVLFFTNSEEAKSDLIDRAAFTYSKSFGKTKLFRAVTKTAKPLSGYVAVDFAHPFLEKDVGSGLDSSLSTFHALADGIEVKSKMFTNKKTIKNSWLEPLFKPYTASLYKKIPVQSSIFFTEGHDLGAMLEGNFKDVESLVDVFQIKNFQRELRPFLNKGFVLSVERQDDLVPAVSFYIDASEAPDAARAYIAQLDLMAPVLASFFGGAFPNLKEKIAVVETFKKTEAGRIIKIYPDRIPQDFGAIPLFAYLKDGVELSYGITTDDILFFTTARNAEAKLATTATIASNSLFNELSRFGPERNSLLFFDVQAMNSYLDFVAEKAPEFKEGITAMNSFFESFKGFVQNTQTYGDRSQARGILKITPP